jgi:response regulator RpfG family c-di-GMP phosphodiesterase
MALILVVEDYDDARELVAMCLQHAGYAVIQAASGEEGVHMAGDAALGRTPIIAFTAQPVAAHTELFSAICGKPAEPSTLLEAIRTALR